ncbi:MAG: ERCC4 domain-containing protein [Gemmatimonadales bacterium]
MAQAIWVVERTRSRRFPFRISIEQAGRLLLAVRAQSAWPGPGQQIFCLRERALEPDEPLEPVERVPIANLTRIGRKLAVLLDRPSRKRCELLTVAKPYLGRDGTYEQIFFRTESGIRSHRSRTRVELRPGPTTDLEPLRIAIDSAERYPWRFPGAAVERKKLRAGDYALLDGNTTTAVIERKSYDNFLAELGAIQALHHQFADLASHQRAAVVVEAQYADFLDEKKLRGRWPPAHLARVLAELTAMHPKLPIVFAGNRKLANLWAERFCAACAAQGEAESAQLSLIRETLAGYDAYPRGPGLDQQIRETVLTGLSGEFAFADLVRRFPEVKPTRLRRVLDELRKEGLVACVGRGIGARWHLSR